MLCKTGGRARREISCQANGESCRYCYSESRDGLQHMEFLFFIFWGSWCCWIYLIDWQACAENVEIRFSSFGLCLQAPCFEGAADKAKRVCDDPCASVADATEMVQNSLSGVWMLCKWKWINRYLIWKWDPPSFWFIMGVTHPLTVRVPKANLVQWSQGAPGHKCRRDGCQELGRRTRRSWEVATFGGTAVCRGQVTSAA